MLPNHPIFFEATLASAAVGATAVPINWHFEPEDVGFILLDCKAKVLVAATEMIKRFESAFPNDLTVVEFGCQEDSASSTHCTWQEYLSHDEIEALSPHSPRPMMYTSGTTGRPKGVAHGARPRSKGSSRALRVYGLDGDASKTVLINGPLYHSVPNAYSRLALQAGASLVLQETFEPEEMLHLVATHRVTHMHIVPMMFRALLQLPKNKRDAIDCSSLRHVVHGASRCTPEVKRAMIEWWGPVIYEYYGSTETGLLTSHGPEEALLKPGTVGRPLNGITLKIFDAEGRVLPVGAAGEVFATSKSIGEFVYNDDSGDCSVFRGPFVSAGDIGWLDDDGYLFLIDRKADVLRRGGQHLFPSRIEAAAMELEGVRDCVTVAEGEAGAVTICLYVQLNEASGLGSEEVLAHLALRLAPTYRPDRIEIVRGLPRENSGKIFKTRL